MEVSVNTDESHLADQNALEMEFSIILYTIKNLYGYDLSAYRRESVLRRLEMFVNRLGLNYSSEIIPKLVHDPSFFSSFLDNVLIGVTEFFRDPEFYDSVKENVLPTLATYPYLKVWHAGCSTGQEPLSMAILLEKNQLLDNSIIYATDINHSALATAKKGIYSTESLNQIHRADAPTSLDEVGNYFLSSYGFVKANNMILGSITYSYHNLICDQSFGKMNLIFCRNVLIYLKPTQQEAVFQLFDESLAYGGFLCLGKGESIVGYSRRSSFDVIDARNRIYRKRYPSGKQ